MAKPRQGGIGSQNASKPSPTVATSTGDEILACEEAGITVTLPKPLTSHAKSEGRFNKQNSRYVAEEDIYICPAGESSPTRFTNEENGLVLRRYWTNACRTCALKDWSSRNRG